MAAQEILGHWATMSSREMAIRGGYREEERADADGEVQLARSSESKGSDGQ
jgi:hypothetical protein